MSVKFNQQENGNICSICLCGDEKENPLLPVKHETSNATHLFHKNCITSYVQERQSQGKPLDCPFRDGRIARIGPYDFPVPAAVAPLLPPENPLVAAAVNGDIAQIGALIAQGNISEEALSLAVRVASKFGHHLVVQALLNNGNITNEAREGSLYWASRGGYLDVIQALGITDDNRGKTIQPASKFGHFPVVQALLASGSISDEHRGEAVVRACAGGHLAILRALLASGQISDEHRGAARTVAYGNQDIIEALRKKRSWIPIVAAATFATGVIAWIANQVLFAD